jgi:hypothetical protein
LLQAAFSLAICVTGCNGGYGLAPDRQTAILIPRRPPTLCKKREGWGTPHAHSPSVPASLASKVTRRPQTCSDPDPSLAQYAGAELRLRAPTPAKRLRLSKNRLSRSVIAASGCPLGGAAAGTIANEAGSSTHSMFSKVFMSSAKIIAHRENLPPKSGANAETLRNWLNAKELIVAALVSNAVSVLEQTVKRQQRSIPRDASSECWLYKVASIRLCSRKTFKVSKNYASLCTAWGCRPTEQKSNYQLNLTVAFL